MIVDLPSRVQLYLAYMTILFDLKFVRTVCCASHSLAFD